MIIPVDSLTKDVLASVLEDIVTRDGTDYGEAELSMPDKVQNLEEQLQRKTAFLLFDEVTESISVVSKDEAAHHGLLGKA